MKNAEKSRLYAGLTSDEVKGRLKINGFNELAKGKSQTISAIIFGVIKEPMFMLLVICGALYLVLGDTTEGFMLLGFVFVIMGIEFYQGRKSERALSALRDMASPRALVIRDGSEIRIPGRELVCDDILILQEGDRVPGDAVVLESINLLVDESLLTGESVPV